MNIDPTNRGFYCPNKDSAHSDQDQTCAKTHFTSPLISVRSTQDSNLQGLLTPIAFKATSSPPGHTPNTENQGFEPWMPIKTHSLSRRADSATLAIFHVICVLDAQPL